MNVLVERYQRRKYVNQENAPMLYYIRQKSGNVRVMDIDTIATAIESKSALTAEAYHRGFCGTTAGIAHTRRQSEN